MGFELFKKSSASRRGNSTPHISILKAGSFSVNRACLDTYLKDVEAVQLFFDADARRIGIKPVKHDAENAYKISGAKRANGSIAARLFLRHYGIDYSKSQKLEAEWDDSMGGIVLRLG